MCVSEYVSITLGDALFTASPGITSYVFLVVRASVFCIYDIPLFSSDTLTLRKDHHQKLLRYVILLYVFLLVALYFCCLCEMAFIALGVSILPLPTLLIYVLELFRQYGIFFHFFTMAIQKNNWKKPDYKERNI